MPSESPGTSDAEARYYEILDECEKELYVGANVFPGWGRVQEAASLREEYTGERTTQNDVIDHLKERNPGVPPWAWKDALKTDKTWQGMREEWGKHTEFDTDDWNEHGQLVDRPD